MVAQDIVRVLVLFHARLHVWERALIIALEHVKVHVVMEHVKPSVEIVARKVVKGHVQESVEMAVKIHVRMDVKALYSVELLDLVAVVIKGLRIILNLVDVEDVLVVAQLRVLDPARIDVVVDAHLVAQEHVLGIVAIVVVVAVLAVQMHANIAVMPVHVNILWIVILRKTLSLGRKEPQKISLS